MQFSTFCRKICQMEFPNFERMICALNGMIILLLVPVNAQLPPPDVARCALRTDVFFIIDGSGSVGRANFQRVLDSVSNLAGSFDIDPNYGTRVAALVYSNAVTSLIRFIPFHDRIEIQEAIRALRYPSGGTRTDLAISLMRQVFIDEKRTGANALCIIITDGRSQYSSVAISQTNLAKQEKIIIASIGVGAGISERELQSMASGPEFVFYLQTFAQLQREVQDIFTSICQASPPVPRRPVVNNGPNYPELPPLPPISTLRPSLPPPVSQRPPFIPPPVTAQPTQPPIIQPWISPIPPVDPPTNSPPVIPPQTTNQPPITGVPVPNPYPMPYPNVGGPPDQDGGPCDGCRYFNGVGYNPIQDDCTKYAQCDIRTGRVVALIRSCSEGLLWDQTMLACNHANAANCVNDQCGLTGTLSYPHNSNCRKYWQCNNGRTTSLNCCSVGQSYRTGVCTLDPSCLHTCPGDADRPRSPPRPFCSKQPGPGGDLTKFILATIGGEWTFDCPPGTLYNAAICDCDHASNVRNGGTGPRVVQPNSCTAELLLHCDNRVRDNSRNELPFFVQNVDIEAVNGSRGGGACRFDGNGRILSWRFSNAPFGQDVYIHIRYQPGTRFGGGTTSNNLPEALVVNSDCNVPPSVILAHDRTSSRTLAEIETKGRPTRLYTSSPNNDWIEAVLRYDGSTFSLTGNDGTIQSQRKSGDIRVCQCALQIGYSSENGYANFTGLIDELGIYFCQPV